MASEKETMSKDDKKEDEPAKDANGDENGDVAEPTSKTEKQKLSLGEIAVIDGEIAKAKTEQLQLLHNLFYGKNGSGPQIKRGIRKFAGFEDADKQKKLDQLLTYDLSAITLTATILDLQDAKKDATKETIGKAIIDFLMLPTGKTFEEVQKDEPEDEELSEPEEEEEEKIKPKPKKGRGGNANSGVRPKRATASRVWTNDYGSSEGEEIEEARPRVGRKKRGDDSDSGSDYNPSGGGSDSEGERRKSARSAAAAVRPTRGGRRGRRGHDSESEEESEDSEEEFSEEEVAPAKKKKMATPNRSTLKRGAAQKGRKRMQESESEDEVSEDEDEELESEDSDKQKKSSRQLTNTKSSPQKKNTKGRPKRVAPSANKKKRKDLSSEEDEEPELSEDDDEPLKKPPAKKGATTDGTPSDDDIKKLLKDILAEANLEEITMKTVCKKVYAHYPNHDLSQRKDFIKQTVKSLIAA